MKGKLLLISLLMLAFANNAHSLESTRFGEVKTNDSAEGLVYASKTEMNIENITDWTEERWLWDFDENDENDGAPPDGTVYWIYAKPKAGYKFKEWRIQYFSYDSFFSSSAKQKVVYDKDDDAPYLAVFSKIGDPHLEGVPADFSVYVDGTKVARDDSGNYTIAEGEDVRIEWSDDAVYGFDQGMDPDEDEKFIEFTMPEDDLVLPLTSVEFPEGLTEIKSYAFYKCKKLTYITLPSTLKSIGASAFEGCSLSTISIPTNVTAIGDCAFYNYDLKDVYYGGAKSQWDDISMGILVFWNPTYHYQHVITFNANGGSLEAPATMVTVDGKLPSLPTPTRNDWFFRGWFTEATGGSKVTTGTEFSKDCDVFAQWYQYSNYTLDLPNVTIAQNTEFTKIEIGVTDLVFAQDATGRTPEKINVALYSGSLVADDSKTIDFKLSTREGNQSGSNSLPCIFTAPGKNHIYIYIPKDTWDNAEIGTYTGTIRYVVNYVYSGQKQVEDKTGFIPVTLTIKPTCTVSTLASPAEGGTVTGSGTYEKFSYASLTATPAEGYRFVRWSFTGTGFTYAGHNNVQYQLHVDDNYTAVAHFERVYALSGQNVLFYPEDGYDHITEAAEGERLVVSANPDCLPAGKYFTGEYSSKDVTLTSFGEYDVKFTMPAKAVKVDVVLDDRQDLVVDMSGDDPVEVSSDVYYHLYRLTDNFYLDETTNNGFLDLNADGTYDLEMINDDLTNYYIKKLPGGYVGNWRFNFILIDVDFSFPYNGIIFDFNVSTPGDINGDGVVNIADVVEFVNAMKLKPSARFNLLNADVNNDQYITQDDIDAVVNMILNH